MGWSEKYKRSINCENPKGFSQRAHCQGRKKRLREFRDTIKEHVRYTKLNLPKQAPITISEMLIILSLYERETDIVEETIENAMQSFEAASIEAINIAS